MPAEEENVINNNNGAAAAAAASSSFLPSLLQHQQPVLKPCAKFFSIQCVVVVFPGKKFDRTLFQSVTYQTPRSRIIVRLFDFKQREREKHARFLTRIAHKKERKKRACVLKKACGNHWSVFLIRVRAPGEETQGIRPPFLNFF